ncbi:hypothetical protein K435DRAFT_966745 [Dendrothele bispora CBS 962.96]|uniref:Uncharacterized protein n=1 Tax=Dendrothele bispora (strain CBS 962.96) TaxID=1314807 RepID=A0A4S8LYA7_DENBC|nr:hypothetical protein K435DRAFT_966745 [Dendrothele bispora CBS 962.96]
MAENAVPSPRHDPSVPRIDFSKVMTASAKKNKNKNRDSKNNTIDRTLTRTPMSNFNRPSISNSGLFSPASSQKSSGSGDDGVTSEERVRLEQEQDPARMLISPPPEEVLQLQNAQRRASLNRSSISYVPPDNNTPSTFLSSANVPLAYDANPTSTSISTLPSSMSSSISKRKRSMAPTLPHPVSNDHGIVRESFSLPQPSDNAADNVETARLPLEATPNPKPRKQTKRAHARSESLNSDMSIDSLPSPTRQPRSRITPSGRFYEADDGDTEETVGVGGSTPRTRVSPSKSRHVTLKSPHANNPDADFIPPFRVILSAHNSPNESELKEDLVSARLRNRRSGRRSATPVIIPPYEPPSEVFTPPREVVHTPSQASPSKSSRTRRKTRGKSLKLVIKTEPPEIDLSEPMPPASPTDDPLLLSGPPEEDLGSPVQGRRGKQSMREAGVLARIDMDRRQEEILPPSSPPSVHHSDDEDVVQDVGTLPPSSSSMVDVPAYFDWNNIGTDDNFRSTDSIEMDVDVHEAASAGIALVDTGFDIHGNPTGPVDASGMWSDSDDDDSDELPTLNRTLGAPATLLEDGVGEYTGHWSLLQVRTKADPPSSATKARMDEWGHPISPYPYVVNRSRSHSRTRGDELNDSGDSPSRGRVNGRNYSPVQDNDDTVQLPAIVESQTQAQDDQDEDQDEAEEREVREMSLGPEMAAEIVTECNLQAEDSQDLEEEMEVRALSIEPEVEAFDVHVQDQETEEEQDEEEQEVREMSIEIEEDKQVPLNDTEEYRQRVSSSPLRLAFSVPPSTPSAPPMRNLSFLGDSARRGNQPRVSSAFEKAAALFGTIPTPSPTRAGTSSLAKPLPEPIEEREGSCLDDELDEDEEMHATLPGAEQELSEGSDDEDSDFDDPGLVRITSSDPKAAARAAAILKQHDYDCYTKILLKQHRTPRNSVSALDDLKRDSRRKSLADAGVTKNKGRASLTARRQTIGGVIGDQVFIPGSPATTLGSLLIEAEQEVQREKDFTPARASPITALRSMELEQKNPFSTPMVAKPSSLLRVSSSLGREMCREIDDEDEGSGPREWTKQEWKVLDGCLTDERLELGQEQDSSLAQEYHEGMPLAGVDMVGIDRVVDRFIEAMGGEEKINGFGWTRENLYARTKALQNKQRAGHVAPPTTPYTPRNSAENRKQRPSMPVPDFTPLGKRPAPPRKTKPPSLPPPVGNDAPFSNIPASVPDDPPRRKVPASLLAPRYSHLLEEAIAVSQSAPASNLLQQKDEDEDEDEDVEPEGDSIEVQIDDDANVDFEATPSPEPASISGHRSRPSLGKKVTGFLFSYLPSLSKNTNKPSSIPRKTSSERRAGLPLPPTEVLEKPRGPVTTPARPAIPKAVPAKELVDLNHRPFPEESKIPRRGKVAPKRMVDLQHVPPPMEKEKPREVTRMRRSSGGSVKDLVQNFEAMEKENKGGSGGELKRVRSIGDWRKGLPGQGRGAGGGRPTWRP